MEQQTQYQYIKLTPDTQAKIVDQILVQSGGVGLGIIATFLTFIILAKWMGVNKLISKWVEKLESDAKSFSSLANSVKDMIEETKSYHATYVANHTKIIDTVKEVKEIVKELTYKLDNK
jgi:hypothetical protein